MGEGATSYASTDDYFWRFAGCLWSDEERMMGLEPTTSCMATSPGTRSLDPRAHG